MTKLPFDVNDDLETKLDVLEQRIRNWTNKKYDLLGIDNDPGIRDKLFDIEMAIFMNQFLYRILYWENLNSALKAAMTGSQEDSIIGKKNNGK